MVTRVCSGTTGMTGSTPPGVEAVPYDQGIVLYRCILDASVIRGHPEPDASASRVVVYPRDGHERKRSALQDNYRAPPVVPAQHSLVMPLITEFKKLARGSHSLLSYGTGPPNATP